MKLELSTTIVTPTGWTTAGELKPGDEVVSGAGELTVVEEVGPAQLEKTYRAEVGSAHARGGLLLGAETALPMTVEPLERLKVARRPLRWSDGPFVGRTMAEVAAGGVTVVRKHGSYSRVHAKHSVPLAGPLELPAQLPVDPYVMGLANNYWYRDRAGFRLPVKYAPYYLPALLETGWVADIEHIGGRVRPILVKMPELAEAFAELDYYAGSDIPAAYMRGSSTQRAAFLHGYFDRYYGDVLGRENGGWQAANKKDGMFGLEELLRAQGFCAHQHFPLDRSRQMVRFVAQTLDELPFRDPKQKVRYAWLLGAPGMRNRIWQLKDLKPVGETRLVKIETAAGSLTASRLMVPVVEES